jgi:hypothetical protein
LNTAVDAEIDPEPTVAERDAVLAALADAPDALPAPLASRWRAAGLVFEDDYDGTARPRRRLGATRA